MRLVAVMRRHEKAAFPQLACRVELSFSGRFSFCFKSMAEHGAERNWKTVCLRFQ